jgi:hypothetical protein
VGAGVALGDCVDVGDGVGGGVGEGVGLGDGEGVGLGEGDGVQKTVGVQYGVGIGVGLGVSWVYAGSDETGLAVGLGESVTAIAGWWPPNTLTTMNSVASVSPATMPPAIQSRRCAGVGRRRTPPWTTPA